MHHTPNSNHLYRASKSLLNSFIKNFSFQYKNKFIFASYHPGWVKTKSSGGGKLSVNESALNFLKFFKKFDNKSNGKFLCPFYIPDKAIHAGPSCSSSDKG